MCDVINVVFVAASASNSQAIYCGAKGHISPDSSVLSLFALSLDKSPSSVALNTTYMLETHKSLQILTSPLQGRLEYRMDCDTPSWVSGRPLELTVFQIERSAPLTYIRKQQHSVAQTKTQQSSWIIFPYSPLLT